MQKKLSLWAKNHVWQTWIIIIIAHFLLTFGAIVLAKVFYFEGLVVSMRWFSVILVGFLLSILFYPIKGKKSGIWKSNYKTRKRSDFIAVFCSFLLVFSFCSRLTVENDVPLASINPYAVQTILTPNHDVKNQRGALKKVRKKLKEFSKQNTQKARKYWNKIDKGVQVLLIILVIALVLIVGYLLAILACFFLCSDMVALGMLILILGAGGLIVGAFFLIRSILRSDESSVDD